MAPSSIGEHRLNTIRSSDLFNQETIMSQQDLWTRRTILKSAGLGAVGALGLSGLESRSTAAEMPPASAPIKQSVCRWCYNQIPLEKLAAKAKEIGYQSIELLTIEEYQMVKPVGLTCAMLGRVSITEGLNRPQYHERIERDLRKNIEFAAAEGLPNVICMAGNRKGMDDEEGLKNCTLGLKRVVGFAEEKNVTICMEGLNSKIDHKDYMYDHTKWGVELCKRVGSPRFKLLYDIYHMQIMEGDVIRTIRQNKEYLAHFHTGGNPGRHEIDDTQELNYPAIIKAILETGYQGFLGQEFIPVRDPLTSLAQGFRICAV
jgi:hydroxypyruvate isomerase